MIFPWVLLLLCVCAAPGARGQGAAAEEAPRPGERDALCHAERGCYAVFIQRKSFREAGRSCREHGGTLATLHSRDAADTVHRLLASMERRGAKARLRLWIGLHRAPRQCSATRALRGFVWVTGDQDGQYTNWLREEAPGACVGPRCVALTIPGAESSGSGGDSFRWLDGACGLPLDGYVCQYHFKGMCAPLEPDAGRAEAPRYTTPFRLTSTLLTHVPFGSVVVAPCPADAARPHALSERTALCVDQEDGSGGVGWSAALPSCSSNMVPQHQDDQEDQENQEDQEEQDWCQGDHGCEHHCQLTDNDYACFCSVGFTLDDDGYGCTPDHPAAPETTAAPTEDPDTDAPPQPDPACVEAGCQHDCVETARGVRCTCPPGYQVGRDGRGCADVDECRQTPCTQQCVNTPGTFHCACHAGYEPDEEGECADVDECRERGRCAGGCQNTEGSYLCDCDEGYERAGSGGAECVDVDECERASPCQQRCVNLAGSFGCECAGGYSLRDDGVTCEPFPDDEGYSALTPDPVDTAAYEPEHTPYAGPDMDQELHWSSSFTPDPGFENDPDADSDWLTEPPGERSPDVAPPRGGGGADDHRLHQREGHAPEQRNTAPPPTQPRLYNADTGDKPDAAKVGGGSGGAAGAVRDRTSTGGRGEARAGEDAGEGEAESGTGKQKHDKSWLLVALLVPLCVFLVVMLALGIVYCTSCAVDKSQSFSDCYRWVLPTTPPVATGNGKPQA